MKRLSPVLYIQAKCFERNIILKQYHFFQSDESLPAIRICGITWKIITCPITLKSYLSLFPTASVDSKAIDFLFAMNDWIRFRLCLTIAWLVNVSFYWRTMPRTPNNDEQEKAFLENRISRIRRRKMNDMLSDCICQLKTSNKKYF